MQCLESLAIAAADSVITQSCAMVVLILLQAVGDILGRLGLPLSLDQKELLSRNLELQASEKGGRSAALLSSAARSSRHCSGLPCAA
jgi:hypothetical protein